MNGYMNGDGWMNRWIDGSMDGGCGEETGERVFTNWRSTGAELLNQGMGVCAHLNEVKGVPLVFETTEKNKETGSGK